MLVFTTRGTGLDMYQTPPEGSPKENVVTGPGLEPGTTGLKVRCSTN